MPTGRLMVDVRFQILVSFMWTNGWPSDAVQLSDILTFGCKVVGGGIVDNFEFCEVVYEAF